MSRIINSCTKRLEATCVLGAMVGATLATPTWATDNVQTHLVQDGQGSQVVESVAPIDSRYNEFKFGDSITVRDGEILWQNYLTDAIYTSAEIAIPPAKLALGTYLNPPKEAQLIPLIGDGTPDWTFAGNNFKVAASRDGNVIAGLDDDGSQKLTVYKWSPGSGTPDWSYSIPGLASPGSYRSIVVSPDGSRIAVLVTQQDTTTARVYYFDSSSSTPLGFQDAGTGYFGRNLSMSADGSYIAFIGLATVYVIDVDANTIRYSVSAGASNDPVAISGDGNWLAYGWSTMYMRQWDGSAYNIAWTKSGGGKYLKSCAFSDDSSTFAAGWYPTTYLQNRIDCHDPASSTPVWSYTYAAGSGGLQDIPGDLALTADGSYLAVASWGDQGNTNPELHVFDTSDGSVAFTIDTPGTMFDCDIADGGDGYVYVSTCGKHIHANTSGRGGDAFSARFQVGIPGDLDGDGCVGQADLGILLASYNVDAGGDIDGDGDTDHSDLGILLGNYGLGC
ncbi:MAG: WD40 repeat domain-containing protein [Phycisphaerales bacterium JB038]